MGFRYTGPGITQVALPAALIGGAFAVAALPGFADAWAAVAARVPPGAFLVIGPFVVHKLAFWPLALLFHRVDTTDRPAAIARHRIQDGPPRRPALGDTLRVLAVNQLVWTPLLLVGLAAALVARGWTVEPALPSAGRVLLELAVLVLAAEVVFYATHRLLHRPWWMKHVHHVHHRFRTTSALASEYAHPVELCLGNFLTLAAGVVLLLPHALTILLFTAVSVTTIVVHHSGYAVPWAPWSVAHDWHHFRYREYFGTLGILDRVFGTFGALGTMREGEDASAPRP